MLIKSNNMKKRFFLLTLIGLFLISVSFILEIRAEDLMITEIIKLVNEERKLDKKIVEMMTFKLAEEQIPIAGDNEKYILKDIRNNTWLFKPDSGKEVKTAKIVSNVAQLLGGAIPILEGITLPINGKDVFGSIQKIGFNDILRLDNVIIEKLPPVKINSLQKLQVMDWLFVAPEAEVRRDTFITSKSGNEILGVDRDDCFKNLTNGRILSLKNDDWNGSPYAKIWKYYVKGKIDIDFWEIFELINYIQKINDSEFKTRLRFLSSISKEQFVEEVIWRKNNSRKEFEKFYRDLAKKRGETLHIPLENNYQNYLKNLLKKVEERILTKKSEYKWLISKGRKKQKNIEVISAREVWILLSSGIEGWAEVGNLQKIIEKAQIMKKNCSFVGEYLAIELYIKQLKTKRVLNVCRIIKHPKTLNPIKIEYNLRFDDYDIFLNNNRSNMSTLEEKNSILAHIRNIEIMKMENKDKWLMSEYMQKFINDPNKKVYLFLAIMSEIIYWFDPVMAKLSIINDDELGFFLDKIDNQFPWKYYGYALCDYGKGHSQDGVKNCERVIDLNNDKEAVYAAYMLLGVFHEHNSENIRFGEGFNIKKAIKNYKKALKINCNSTEAYLNLANLYLIKESSKKALKKFKKITELSPQYAKEYFHLENIEEIYSYRNKEEYLEAIKMNTLNGEGHYILGLAYMVKKDYRNAKKHFNKAKEFGYVGKMSLKKDKN